MKKKVLPLAVGAATAVTMSAAHAAMYINDKGMGETLIFPFYSAESGNNTAIHVVNTTAGTKAVKVRSQAETLRRYWTLTCTHLKTIFLSRFRDCRWRRYAGTGDNPVPSPLFLRTVSRSVVSTY